MHVWQLLLPAFVPALDVVLSPPFGGVVEAAMLVCLGGGT